MPEITKSEFENLALKTKLVCISAILAGMLGGGIGYQYTTQDWPEFRQEMFKKYLVADLMVAVGARHWIDGKETIFFATKKDIEARFPAFAEDALRRRFDLLWRWCGGGALIALGVLFSAPKAGFKKGS